MARMSDAAIEIENAMYEADPEEMMVLDEILYGEDLTEEGIGEMGKWTPCSKARAVYLGLIAWK